MRADADDEIVGRTPVDGLGHVEGGRGEAGVVLADARSIEIDNGAELRLVHAE